MIRVETNLLTCVSVVLAVLAAPFARATIIVPTNQPTIQAAINAALPGEDIFVLAGTYPEGTINVTLPVQIYGPNVGVTPTQARATEARILGGFVLTSDNVTIQGLEIMEWAADPFSFRRAVSGPQALNGIDISYNWMHQPIAAGITVAVEMGDYNLGVRSSNLAIRSNLINDQVPGVGTGIFLYASDGAEVVGNMIVMATVTTANGDYGFPGIVLDGVHSAIVAKNDIDVGQSNPNNSSAAYGIGVQAGLDDIHDVRIANNRIRNCVSGVLSSSLGFAVRNLSISKNEIVARMFGVQFQAINVGTNAVSHDVVSINNNHFTAGNYCVGILGGSAPSRTMSDFVIRRNCFAATTGSTGVFGVVLSSNATIPTNGGVVDARFNYWDAANGPSTVGTGSGLRVGTRVDFRRWLETCPH